MTPMGLEPAPFFLSHIHHLISLDPDNERDQLVGDWIDHQPNASETVKALIYAMATGSTNNVTYAQRQSDETQQEQLETTDPRVQALAGAIEN